MTDAAEEPVVCLGGCGHQLHSDLAVARGYGERCWRKLHRRTRRQHATTVRPARATAGQLAFDDPDPDDGWFDDLILPPPDLLGQHASEDAIRHMTTVMVATTYL